MSTVLPLLLVLSLSASPEAQAPVRLFAPGVVSTGHEEFGATFTPDGGTVVFNRADPTRYAFQLLMVSHQRGGRWTAPEVLPFSGRFRDIDPAFSPDGRRLFFASDRPHTEGGALRADFDLWFVERQGRGWSAPRLAEGANTPESETNSSLTQDGTLYVTRRPTGAKGARRIFRHTPQGEGWAAGELLPEAINSGHGDGNHFVDPDGRYLLFTSERPGGTSRHDLYVSLREGEGWGTPRNLGPGVSRTDGVLTPAVVPARGTLVFAQRRPFADAALPRALSTREFAQRLASPGNGLGDLYEVPLGVVGLPVPAPVAR